MGAGEKIRSGFTLAVLRLPAESNNYTATHRSGFDRSKTRVISVALPRPGLNIPDSVFRIAERHGTISRKFYIGSGFPPAPRKVCLQLKYGQK
jgi:hypothetical protein